MWVRNMYNGPGGGMYNGPGGGMFTGPGGGMFTGPGGGLYTGPSGGLYTGPDSKPYMAIHPPWTVLIEELQKIGMSSELEIIKKALQNIV